MWWRPGALADLLVIDGNPLDDIRVLTTPEANAEAHHEAGHGLQERAGGFPLMPLPPLVPYGQPYDLY